MAAFHLGAVSNCWAAQLPETGLEAQCRAALERGFEYVELRQRALAECEERVPGDERPWPLPEQLRRLRSRFPDLGFNLAVELPFLTEPVDPRSAYLDRLAEGALALAGSEGPLLRFVDVSPAPALLTADQVERLSESVAALTASLRERGVRTALENSKQPVGTLMEVIRRVSDGPDGAPGPLLCWDAANQVQQTFVAEDPVETARATPAATLFEFHFKQLRDGVLLPGVGEGDLDWAAILSALAASGFEGPALFEIPPGDDVWKRLDEGAACVRGLLAALER